MLYSGNNRLAFQNDFGSQTFNASDGGVVRSEDTAVLQGNIIITGEAVSAAAPGNYTGTTTFSISWKEGSGETDNPGDTDPDDSEETPEPGRYTADVSLWHATNDALSMGNAALQPQGVLVVAEDGSMTLELTFQAISISGLEGYLYRLRKVDMSTVVYNDYNYPVQYEADDASVLEYYTGVHDGYNDPDSPSYDANTEGKEYPKVVSIPVEQGENMNYVEIYVPVMEAISTGQGTQIARLSIDWDSLQAETDDPGTEDPGDGTLDITSLPDGVYSVTGNMVKVDKTTPSMSDNAINHTVKLTVRDGKYYITMDFNGLTIGSSYGYLSQLKYFLTGYTTDQYGNPQGSLADVTVDSYQSNEDGSPVSDSYGTNYPNQVTFELIPEALEDGFVPLQVFVPIMEAIAEGTGTQPVYLSLDWSTI